LTIPIPDLTKLITKVSLVLVITARFFVLHRRFFLRVLSQGITAQVRYFLDFDNGKLGGNYYTMPLNFLNDYPQGHNSNDGLATHKLGVLGCRVRFLQVSDINDHIVDIANSLIP
jgi:hypothetical protein